MAQHIVTEEFWDFSRALYARTGVAEYCLQLQDETGANVNLLLLCCWAGGRGTVLDAAALTAASAAIEDWEARILRPLRARRRAAGIAPAEKQRLLAEELRAEQREQTLLLQWLENSGFARPHAAAGAAAIRANLHAYGRTLGVALENSPLIARCGPELLRHPAARQSTGMHATAKLKSVQSDR